MTLQPSQNTIPEHVLSRLRIAVAALEFHKAAVEQCRTADQMFGGGRYEAEYSKEKLNPLAAAIETVTLFRELAPKNGVDAEVVLETLGWSDAVIKSLELSKAAREWLE